MHGRKMSVAAATLSVIGLMGATANAQIIGNANTNLQAPPPQTSTLHSQSWRARWRRHWIYRWRLRTERAHLRNNSSKSSTLPPTAFTGHAGAVAHQSAASVKQIANTKLPLSSSPMMLTRQDTNSGKDKPIASPMQTVGQGVSMLVYLLPVLFLIVGGLQLIKHLQHKLTRGGAKGLSLQSLPLPAPTGRQSGGMVAAITRSIVAKKQPVTASSCNIRLVESTPLGNSCLALVEVRGKLLLLGVSGSSVALITEFEEQGHENDSDFRALMRAAAMDLDGVDFAAAELPSSAIMGDLGEAVAAAGSAVTRSLQRLRTVAEVEGAL